MNVTLTGATGLIGTGIVRALQARGDAVTVLSRDPDKARAALGDVDAHAWRPREEPAPAAALSGRDAVVHLAGESVAQRWSDDARRAIHDSREIGTRNLVAGLATADPRPGVLVSASGVNYYGPRGDEPLTEDAPPGDDFLARVCMAWEREAAAARELGLRVATLRLYLAALDGADWVGAANACAPEPATNRDFSRALGRALHRPALAPVPGFAVRLLYGDMAEIVTTGQRTVPMRALEHGYAFRHTDLDEALRDALG